MKTLRIRYVVLYLCDRLEGLDNADKTGDIQTRHKTDRQDRGHTDKTGDIQTMVIWPMSA